MKILILGAGNMTEAILEGLKNEADLSEFYIYSPSGISARELAKKVGAKSVSSLDEVKDPAFVWIGCKPQQLKDLAKNIAGKFSNATFVSMLAASSEADQLKLLQVKKLIRIMPNLSVRFKSGVTLVSSQTGAQEVNKIVALFSLLGLALEVGEEELEELTLLTGSGPALFYEFTKYLTQSFSSLTENERERLGRMVLTGAGDSVRMNYHPLSKLIDGVTSKAGVTIAVLEAWRQSSLQNEIKAGIDQGKLRSLQIKDSLRQS